MDLNNLVCMKNKYLLVTPFEKQKVLANGLNIKEARGKRDIIIGVIEASEPGLKLPEKAVCWFPIYAGSAVLVGEKEYLAVPFEDVIMIERVPE
jgi:hypothetical protein